MTQGSRAFVTVGLPLFVLTLSGFYGLSHLVQGKYEVQVHNLNNNVILPTYPPQEPHPSSQAMCATIVSAAAGTEAESCRSQG